MEVICNGMNFNNVEDAWYESVKTSEMYALLMLEDSCDATETMMCAG